MRTNEFIELPCLNGRKSFYQKAYYFKDDKNCIYLKSYGTTVCKIENNGKGNFVKLYKGCSQTTMYHINSFRLLFDLETITKKEWELMEVEQ